MQVLDPGHEYKLDTLDEDILDEYDHTLRFVKRIGEKYPGNHEPGYGGTTSQEVIRALIDRTKYVNAQEPHVTNDAVLDHLRKALYELEARAAHKRYEWFAFHTLTRHLFTITPSGVVNHLGIEHLPTCSKCGHLACGKHL